MIMASVTNNKSNMEPLASVVEKDQLDKAEDAAALCVVDGKPADTIAVAGSGGDKKAPAAAESRGQLTALPKDEVERILSWKRGKLTSIYSTPEAIELFETLSDHCAEYQAWMRAEYDANGGVVLVDDEFLRDQAEGIQELKDYWKEEKLGEANDDFDFSRWP